MPKSFMIFHGIECSLFSSSLHVHSPHTFFFASLFFFLFFSRPYLSPFFSVCVFLLCHLRDSVHILAAFSTIIFPFVVLCFYCLLLFFVVVFFLVFSCFFYFYGWSLFFYRDFVSVSDIGKTHLYAFFLLSPIDYLFLSRRKISNLYVSVHFDAASFRFAKLVSTNPFSSHFVTQYLSRILSVSL